MSEVLFSHIEATSWGSTPGFSHPHYAVLDPSPPSGKKKKKQTLLITFLLPLVEQTRGKPSDPPVMNVGYRFERDRDGFPARKVKWLHPFPSKVVLIQPAKFCKWQSHLSIEF